MDIVLFREARGIGVFPNSFESKFFLRDVQVIYDSRVTRTNFTRKLTRFYCFIIKLALN